MENKAQIFNIAEGITGLYVKTDKFKSSRISVSFVTENSKFNSTAGALLSKVLCRSCEEFPETVEMKKELQSLYGATLSGSTMRYADWLFVKIRLSHLSDRFALEGEKISELAVRLMCSAIFRPNAKDGEFCAEDFEVEKRLLMETVKSKINEKRLYAISRMLENMCEDEPFGIPEDGYLETAQSITNRQLFDFRKGLLEKSPVIITVVGGESPNEIFNLFKEEFEKINRDLVDIKPSFTPVSPKEIKRCEDKLPVTQGKLVMGFRAETSSIKENIAPLKVMTDILGGGPYSKLFTEVREKQSLCYYCAARLYAAKGIVCIDSGVEFENFEKTENGISEQIEAICRGEFDDEVINASKMSISDSLASVNDSLLDMEIYYLIHWYDCDILKSPEEWSKDINNVTKEQIIKAAKSIKLDTVYYLKGKDGENND